MEGPLGCSLPSFPSSPAERLFSPRQVLVVALSFSPPPPRSSCRLARALSLSFSAAVTFPPSHVFRWLLPLPRLRSVREGEATHSLRAMPGGGSGDGTPLAPQGGRKDQRRFWAENIWAWDATRSLGRSRVEKTKPTKLF